MAITLPDYDESADDYKHKTADDDCIAWCKKPLHSQFLRQVSDLICPKTQWLWLKFGKCTKELRRKVLLRNRQFQLMS